MSHEIDATQEEELYQLDRENRERLVISAPLMWEWARTLCAAKPIGGMEEWAKMQRESENPAALTCGWYHSTWQFLRLLNMVAVPPWYQFYDKALGRLLNDKPDANVLISAAADYGMLATLHESIVSSGASPTITLYDICRTPLRATEWYAERYGLTVTCLCDNLLTSPGTPIEAYDLVVTDEFLTVLKDPDKPLIVQRWKQFLKPGGVVVTTAMVGGPPTPALRRRYAERARNLLESNAELFENAGLSHDELTGLFERFADVHTRHMIRDGEQIRSLFADFRTEFTLTPTPGECVNPTYSFQIVATKAD